MPFHPIPEYRDTRRWSAIEQSRDEFLAAEEVGAVGAAGVNALRQGHQPSSRSVVVAAIAGALVAVVIRRTIREAGLLVETLAALAGALLKAFATRARISAAIAPGKA